MALVYCLKGTSGRHYIGATEDLEARVARHNAGLVYSSKRLGIPLVLVASREFDSMNDALKVERQLKRLKSPAKAIQFLNERR
ncbi:MAG: GIY-YIG nuclease family protein [Verrucomicrobiota bacterium]